MPDLSKAQLAIENAEKRARIAEIANRLQSILEELDAIGPMLAGAHLALAIETLLASIADPPLETG